MTTAGGFEVPTFATREELAVLEAQLLTVRGYLDIRDELIGDLTRRVVELETWRAGWETYLGQYFTETNERIKDLENLGDRMAQVEETLDIDRRRQPKGST